MNKYIKFLLAVLLIPITVVIALFTAQILSSDAHVVAQQGNMQQRVEQYKSSLQNQPSKGDLDKLKLRCSVAQDRLKTFNTKVVGIKQKRIDAYNSINKSLDTLIQALKAKSIATTTLEQNSKDLKAKTDVFATDMVSFSQAIEDASSLDCANDPLALMASIESARGNHVKLIQEVADIRNEINNVIKTTLKQVKDDLVTQQKASTATPATDNPANPTTGTVDNNSQPNSQSPDISTQPQGGVTPNATQ